MSTDGGESTARAAIIESPADVAAFARSLLLDLKEHPERWENADLPSYLEALAAWVEDMDGYYLNQGKPAPHGPSWQVMGDMLAAAGTYE